MVNQYKTARITGLKSQSRVKNIYTQNAYEDYMQSNDNSLCGIGEVIGDINYQIKPPLDFDRKDGGIFDDTYIADITKFINDKYGLTVKLYKRDDRMDDGKMKSSLRGVIQNCRISYPLITTYFAELFDRYEHLDTSIYSSNRVLLSIGNKHKIDRSGNVIKVPELKPLDDDYVWDDYMSTLILESYKDLDELVDVKIREEKIGKAVKKVEMKEKVGNPIVFEEEEKSPMYSLLQNRIKHLSKKRSTDYNSWLSVSFAIVNIGKANDMSDNQINRLIHIFSEIGDNYDPDKVDDWYSKNIDRIRDVGYGWPYIYQCLKEDDEKYFNSMTMNYYNKKKEFELTHIKCLYPPTIIYIDNDNIKLQSIPNSIKTYNHIDCYVKEKNAKGEVVTKKSKFIKCWLDDHNIRVVSTMVTKPPPLTVNDNEYNLWTDFEIRKVIYTPNDDIIRLFLEFGKNLLGEEYMNFSIAIFAQRLQTPANRAYVLQLLYSQGEGTGKNTWFNIFMNIFGKKKFKQLESADQLFNTHSAEEKDSLFILVDEARGIDNYKNADRLKSRITCDRITINPKGIDAYELDNYCDYGETTNNHNCLPQTDESRRFAPNEVSEYYKGNVLFFTRFNDMIINNQTSLRCIYEYLMKFDVTKVIPTGNFQNHIPNTDFRNQLNSDNRNRVELFIEAIAYDDADIDLDDDGGICKPRMFSKFVNWMSANRFECKYNAISFGRKLSNAIKSKSLPITSNQRRYFIDMDKLKEKFS